jgi:putative DNA primase/helicase
MAVAAIDAADERSGINVARDDPYRLARLYLRLHHHHDHRATLVCQGDAWLAWDGHRWHDLSEDLENRLFRTARSEFERCNRKAMELYNALPQHGRDGERPPTVQKVERRMIGNIRLALEAIVRIPGEQPRPSWLEGAGPGPAHEILAFPNALVHLPRFAAGRDDYGIDPTPRFFSTHCIPFDFDPAAAKPALWLEFLKQILGDDPQAQELLQEWFGLCLTADTSQQKILMLVGPPRSGKGTIGRVLTELLGPDQVASLSFSSLPSQFGAESLIGKTLAVAGDARLSGRVDQAALVERLLSISGEDRITIDRKYRPAWEGTLPSRLMLLSNELPELRDASLALANRLLIIELKRSFLGQEDTELTRKLLSERSGILLWAIEGWKRLQERGHFVSPESSQGAMAALKSLSSPISAFVDECCRLGPEQRITVKRLFEAYRWWCYQQSKKPLDQSRFGQQLHAAVPSVENKRLRDGSNAGKRTSYYTGIALQPGVLPSSEEQAS